MTVDKKCKDCGAVMKEIRQEKVASTIYYYMKCMKCNKEVARRGE